MGKWVGILVTHSPVVSTVPVVLGTNILKNLDLTWLLTKSPHGSAKGCEDQVVWQNMIHASELHRWKSQHQPEKVGVVRLHPKQRLQLPPKIKLSLLPPCRTQDKATRSLHHGGRCQGSG